MAYACKTRFLRLSCPEIGKLILTRKVPYFVCHVNTRDNFALRCKMRFKEMSWKSDLIALVFGMLLILVTFNDSHLIGNIGNLDSIFGPGAWQLLDVAYALCPIVVFLLYGLAKGGLRINARTVAIFLSFLVVSALISVDDVAFVLHFSITLPKSYWVAVEWFYPIYSIFAFFVFGRECQVKEMAG